MLFKVNVDESVCEVTERGVVEVWAEKLTILQKCIPSIRSPALGRSLVLVGALGLGVPRGKDKLMKN